MLYKHLFSILCGHLNLNQKRKKFEFDRLPVKPTGYQLNRPVNRSNRPVSRSEPVEHAILNLNLNLTGFRPNRSGIPVPDPAGLAGPVGKRNPVLELAILLLLAETSSRSRRFPASALNFLLRMLHAHLPETVAGRFRHLPCPLLEPFQ